jgi:hypothetical protein
MVMHDDFDDPLPEGFWLGEQEVPPDATRAQGEEPTARADDPLDALVGSVAHGSLADAIDDALYE